jgi:hypothetical protein
VSASAFAADSATTQPSRPFDRRPEGRADGPFRAMRRPMPPGMNPNNNNGAVFGPMSEEERAQIEQFMRAYSPKRWEKFQDVPDDRKDKILNFIRTQYHWMERLKEEDPKIYDIRIKRVPIEDEMFAIGWEIHHSDSKSVPELRKRLREQVRLFVSNSLEERRARLDRWRDRLKEQQDWLNKQQADLDRDSKRVDELVEKGLDSVDREQGSELKALAGPLLGPRPRFFDASPPSTAPSPTPAPE